MTPADVEAALWRLGLAAEGVDEVLALVQALAGSRGGERGAQGPGGAAEGLDPGPEPGSDLAAELAGEVAGSACRCAGRARVEESGTGVPVTCGGVSTVPVEAVAEAVEKVCATCGVAQPPGGFHRDANKPGGRRASCKGCERVRRLLRRRELAAVRRVVARGGDPAALLAAIEERVAAERELRAVAQAARRVGVDGRRVVPALDAATLAVALSSPVRR